MPAIKISAYSTNVSQAGQDRTAKKIDGQTGPFDSEKPGNYGRNAADAYASGITAKPKKDRFQSQWSFVRYTPKDSLNQDEMYQNLFGYGEQLIHRFDKNKDGRLNSQEWSRYVKAANSPGQWLARLVLAPINRRYERKSLQSFDLNGDNQIDTFEMGAKALFEDGLERFEYDGARDESSFWGTPDGEIHPGNRIVSQIAVATADSHVKHYVQQLAYDYRLVEHFDSFKGQ